MKQEMMGGSDISWTICKSLAHCSRQTTMPAPHHSIFTGRILFLTQMRVPKHWWHTTPQANIEIFYIHN